MMFFSTRDSEKKLFKASEVIKQGLASDGGLFVPESIPTLTQEEIFDLKRAAIIITLVSKWDDGVKIPNPLLYQQVMIPWGITNLIWSHPTLTPHPHTQCPSGDHLRLEIQSNGLLCGCFHSSARPQSESIVQNVLSLHIWAAAGHFKEDKQLGSARPTGPGSSGSSPLCPNAGTPGVWN